MSDIVAEHRDGAGEDDPRVRALLIDHVMAMVPPSILMLNVVLAAFALYVFRGSPRWDSAAVWVVGVAAVAVYNAAARTYYLRNRDRFWTLDQWVRFLSVSFVLNGVAWGCGAAVLYEPEFSLGSLYILCAFLIIVIGTAAGQGAVGRLVWPFLTAALLPLGYRLATVGPSGPHTVTVLLAVTLGVLILFMMRHREAIVSAVILKVRNEELAAVLGQREVEVRRAEERAAEAQTRLFDAIERIDEPLVLWDGRGAVLRSNASARAVLPAASEIDPSVGLATTARRLLGDDAEVLADGTDNCRLEATLPDRRVVRCALHRTAAGDTAMVCVDLTEARARERALREAQEGLRRTTEQAEAANRAKSTFLAHMSHELRTPLNAVIGFAEIIRDRLFGADTDRYAEYAGYIYDSGGHLLDLINSVLDLSKIESGKYDLDERPVDIQEVAAVALRLAGGRGNGPRLRLAADLPEGLPRLWADQLAVRQMLINLVANAVRFTAVGGAVTVSAEVVDRSIVVRVVDTGIGIAAQDLPKVLEPFGQVTDPMVPSGAGGAGLGVPIVKSLMEMHGGRLEIDSQPGVGTTVSLRFPPERTLEN